MKKILVLTSILVSFATTVCADYLKAGVIMCNNADPIRKIVELHLKGDSVGVINYFSDKQVMGICNQTVAAMTPSSLGREDLLGGVTKIGSIYVVTSDIK